MRKRELHYEKLDMTRKEVIKVMWHRESFTLTEIRGRLSSDYQDMTKVNVWKHLQVLKKFGFVDSKSMVNEGIVKTRSPQFSTVFLYSLTSKGEHAADYFFGK